jgi:hypothetical protein
MEQKEEKRGGARPGAGRKSRAQEWELIDRLAPYADEAHEALFKAIKKEEAWAIKLFLEYFHGKPLQRTENKHDFSDVNLPILEFVKNKDANK